MSFSLISIAAENNNQETEPIQYLKDTGDGYWLSYESGLLMAQEREEFKVKINELEIEIAELKGDLKQRDIKIVVLKEARNKEYEQYKIVIQSKDKVISGLESKITLKNEKIDLQSDVIKLKDEELADLKELYRNKGPNLGEKLKWAAGGAGIAVVLSLLAGIAN